VFQPKLRYETTAKTVYDQPYSTSDQKDGDQSKLIKIKMTVKMTTAGTAD